VPEDKDQRRTRISTKSGFERRQENKKKGAIAASRKKSQGQDKSDNESGNDDGWDGLDE
jgi:ATP-dependent RNA helicase DDX52/ROK1